MKNSDNEFTGKRFNYFGVPDPIISNSTSSCQFLMKKGNNECTSYPATYSDKHHPSQRKYEEERRAFFYLCTVQSLSLCRLAGVCKG